MKCKECGSTNLDIIKSGPHQKLVCCDCLTYQKFLNKSQAKTFKQLRRKYGKSQSEKV
jgi:transcription initiation factor TFIIIB Brf1 subunit/transcription initiation factor TFIIB